MPYFSRGNAKLYFLEQGKGFPLITIHGLAENSAYWRLPGVTDQLAEEFQVVSMDMRAHGYSGVTGEPPGYDAETVAADIIALADRLGFERFHLLAHCTGGFAAIRHAMKDASRFASLILTNTAAAALPEYLDMHPACRFRESMACFFENTSWEAVLETLRASPGPFFRGIMEAGQSEAMMQTVFEMLRQNNPHLISDFLRRFYADPFPRNEDLARVDCPTLIVCGEKDDMFIGPSRLMAQCIPGAELLEYEGVGHMTAIEAPHRLADDILAFIRQTKNDGFAASYGFTSLCFGP